MPKSQPSDRWFRDCENKLYDQQFEIIKKEYGVKAARAANYGWGVDIGEDFVSIATKVYVPGRPVLQSYRAFGEGPNHDWNG